MENRIEGILKVRSNRSQRSAGYLLVKHAQLDHTHFVFLKPRDALRAVLYLIICVVKVPAETDREKKTNKMTMSPSNDTVRLALSFAVFMFTRYADKLQSAREPMEWGDPCVEHGAQYGQKLT